MIGPPRTSRRCRRRPCGQPKDASGPGARPPATTGPWRACGVERRPLDVGQPGGDGRRSVLVPPGCNPRASRPTWTAPRWRRGEPVCSLLGNQRRTPTAGRRGYSPPGSTASGPCARCAPRRSPNRRAGCGALSVAVQARSPSAAMATRRAHPGLLARARRGRSPGIHLERHRTGPLIPSTTTVARLAVARAANSRSGLVTPVEVSLWVSRTARYGGFAARWSARTCGSRPLPGTSKRSTSAPNADAIFASGHRMSRWAASAVARREEC